MHDSGESHMPVGHYGLLQVSGIDAQKFLQGQLTCNLNEISETESRLGAHCNPQGRVLFLFRLFRFQEAYYLVMPEETLATALQSLKKYARFFKLTLAGLSHDLPATLQEKAIDEWRYFDLGKGIPQVYPETSGLFLPQELRLHELQGLSFNKGCYTGQEIIARLHYKGKLKNKLYAAKLHTPARPSPGSAIYQLDTASEPSGTIVDCRQLSYNLYQILVLTTENNRSHPLRLDPGQNETWEWLTEHG